MSDKIDEFNSNKKSDKAIKELLEIETEFKKQIFLSFKEMI